MSAANKFNDIRLLENLVPLNELDHDKLSELAESSSVLKFKKGQSISSATARNQLIYLLTGTVECSPGAAHAEIIDAISQRARQAILAPDKRKRVVAKNDVTVLCVDNDMLDLLRSWGSSGGFDVDEIDTSESSGWADGLMQSEVLLNLSPSSIQALMSAIVPVEFARDEVIFKQGDEPDYYYIVSRGHCSITHRATDQDSPVELATLGPGDVFGEEALIANTARNATALMTEDGLVLRLGLDDFKKLLEQPFVKTISIDKAEKLKKSGAVVLDLRPADEFARDGSGMNIPFAELRSRIGELAKDKKYLVVSDDNKMSAVAAFLLSQKRFNVYLLKTAAKEEIVANAAKVNAQAKELHSKVSELQQQLEHASTKLQKQEKSHADTKGRAQLLEDELKTTQDSARSAILEASNLKNKSESAFRSRMEELTDELQKEKQQRQSLIEQNDCLKGELESVQNNMQQEQLKSETDSVEVSEIEKREAELNQTISQLNNELEELQQSHEQVVNEKESLSNRLNETDQITTEGNDELRELQSQLQNSSERVKKTEHELHSLQEQHSELQSKLELTLDEKQSLNTQLVEANQNAEQLTNDINEIQDQLSNSDNRVEKAEQELQALQQKQSELESRHEQTLEENQSLNDQLNEAKQKAGQQADELNELRLQLQSTDERAEKTELELQGLQEQHSKLESNYGQMQEENDSLNDQLNEARQKADQQSNEMSELQSKLHSTSDRADKAEHELSTTQAQLEEVGSNLEQSEQANQHARQQIKDLAGVKGKLEGKIATFDQDLRIQEQAAQQERDSLKEQLQSMKSMLVEKKSQFMQAESGYQQQIEQLGADLNKVTAESKQLTDEASKEKLRNKILTDELSRLQDENKRSGTKVRFLLLVLLLLVAAVAMAYYLGIDLHEQTTGLIEEAVPQLNDLIDSIPQPGSLKSD